MQSATKFRRPCDQCRASFNYNFKRGEYQQWESVSGVRFISQAGCCGAWVVSFPSDTRKLTYRRPTRLECKWEGN